MAEIKLPLNKCLFLVGLVLFYILFGIAIKVLLVTGMINPSVNTFTKEENKWELGLVEAPYRLEIAKSFVSEVMAERNGHINLIYPINFSNSSRDTNSEAISYYLLWNVLSYNKQTFDKELTYIENGVIHPKKYYLMWRLNSNDTATLDGENIATDADLRAIKALYLAENQWNGGKYKDMADKLAVSLEEIAITEDLLFAPYGGFSNSAIWTTHEVWLSYADFEAFAMLSEERGKGWKEVYNNMKKAFIEAQLQNGLYNSKLDEERKYSNSLDNGAYSINSLWMMVRAAESGDEELRASAQKSLDFYKSSFETDGVLHNSYDASGNAVDTSDSPWVYALVGRAAIELGDREFAEKMITKLMEFQVMNEESLYFGAFVEGSNETPFVTQFTMQESILTFEAYNEKSKSDEGN